MYYKVNLATEVIKSNQLKFKVFKVVNYITLVIGIAVLGLVGYTVYNNVAIGKLELQITNLINTIDNKRSAEVLQMEQLWGEYDSKLSAVSEILSNSTKYGLMLKEFATNLPAEAITTSISVSGDNMNIAINVPQNVMSKLKSFYDYTDELKSSFEKSFFINAGSIKIASWITEPDKKKPGFETLNVQFQIYSRKRV